MRSDLGDDGRRVRLRGSEWSCPCAWLQAPPALPPRASKARASIGSRASYNGGRASINGAVLEQIPEKGSALSDPGSSSAPGQRECSVFDTPEMPAPGAPSALLVHASASAEARDGAAAAGSGTGSPTEIAAVTRLTAALTVPSGLDSPAFGGFAAGGSSPRYTRLFRSRLPPECAALATPVHVRCYARIVFLGCAVPRLTESLVTAATRRRLRCREVRRAAAKHAAGAAAFRCRRAELRPRRRRFSRRAFLPMHEPRRRRLCSPACRLQPLPTAGPATTMRCCRCVSSAARMR